MFRAAFLREGYVFDSVYDWVQTPPVVVYTPMEVIEEPITSNLPTRLMELGRGNNPSAPVLPVPVMKAPAVKVAAAGPVERQPARAFGKPGVPLWMIPPGVKQVQRPVRAV
jgi:hypothetical protein